MYDVTIIGAGIIGLATGLKILEKNPKTKILFLEKKMKFLSTKQEIIAESYIQVFIINLEV